MKTKKETLEQWFKEVWYEGNTETIHRVFVPEPQNLKAAHGLAKEEKLSPQEYEQFQQTLLSLISEVNVVVDSHIEQGDWLFTACTVYAKSKKTGEDIKFEGSTFVKIVDEKIVEAKNYFDFISLFEAIGLMPENTFAKCLTGEGI